MLPWWVEYGAIVGWSVVAIGALLGFTLAQRTRRRKLRDAVDARLADLGAPASAAAASDLVTLRGRLRARGERRLERPEDGAPCVAVGLILPPRLERPRIDGRCEAIDALEDLELELDSGERVYLDGPIELALGSSETDRPRRRQILPSDVSARVAALVEPLSLEPQAIVAFRSLCEGDRVLARGTLEATPSDGADYRSAAADRTLRRADDDGCVRLAFASSPRLRWTQPWRAVVPVVIGAAIAFGAIAAGGALSEGARPSASELDGSFPPFGTPHWSYGLAAASPLQRSDAITDLAHHYGAVAPMDEHHARAAVRALQLRSCDSALSWLQARRHYEEVARDTVCEGPFTAERRFEALFALGRFEEAAAVADATAMPRQAAERAFVYIALERWSDAAVALAEREQHWRELASGGPALGRVSCVRAAVLTRANQEVPVEAWFDPSAAPCRLTAADQRAPGERAEALGELASMRSMERELAELLLLEGGEELTPQAGWASGYALRAPSWYTLDHTGLHAAALRAYEQRRASEPRALAARIGAQQAVFEAWTGDLPRAERIARRALVRSPGDRFTATSVLVLARLQRGDVAGARAQYAEAPQDHRAMMERWVRLLGLRDASRMEPDASADPYREAAIAGDGARMALLISTDYGGSSEVPLLTALVRDDRQVLIEALRWEGLFDRHSPRRMLARWAAVRWSARELGDTEGQRRAERALRRFRSIVLRRETAVLLALLEDTV